MLNFTVIQELYKSLTRDRKKELLTALFGTGNQGISYFKKQNNPHLSKVEILSDFFKVPLDSLREGTSYVYNPKTATITPDKKSQADSDKQKILLLEERIKLLQDALTVKEEHINLLIEKNEFYKSQAGK